MIKFIKRLFRVKEKQPCQAQIYYKYRVNFIDENGKKRTYTCLVENKKAAIRSAKRAYKGTKFRARRISSK